MNRKAVSPVVGVMLMLVITVILAAVVSSYSGSLVSPDNGKTWQLVISAKATTEDFTIHHEGGDPIPFTSFKLVIVDPDSYNTTQLNTTDSDGDGIPDVYTVTGNGNSAFESGESFRVSWSDINMSVQEGEKLMFEMYEVEGNSPIAKATAVVE